MSDLQSQKGQPRPEQGHPRRRQREVLHHVRPRPPLGKGARPVHRSGLGRDKLQVNLEEDTTCNWGSHRWDQLSVVQIRFQYRGSLDKSPPFFKGEF